MEHAFNTNVAAEYDVNIALLIQHFKHWTLNNLANKRHLHEGLCWTYNTVHAFCEIFHYWTRHQIEHLLKKAETQQLIVSGNHNQNKYDRTKWYALTPKAYHFYDELQSEAFLNRLYSSISSHEEMHKCLVLPISENSEMEFGDFRNLFLKFPKPIPDTKPDTDPNINNKSVSDETHDDDKSSENKFRDGNENSNLRAVSETQEENTDEFEDVDNQTLGDLQAKKGIDRSSSYNKSDYHKKQTLNCTVPSNIIQYDINNILQNNIFQIPDQLIQDWITNRKKKRAAVTQTAWNKINKELAKCKEQGIEPVDAFEKMVAHGWQALDAEWFTKERKGASGSQWDVDAVMRA